MQTTKTQNKTVLAKSRRGFLRAAAGAATVACFPRIVTASKTASQLQVVGEGDYLYECLHDWGTLPDGHQYGGASHGVAVDSNGLVYVSHHGAPGSVFVFDAEGKFVRSMAKQFESAGHGIDIRREGDEEFIYLSMNNFTDGFAKLDMKGDLVWHKGKETIARDSGLYEKRNARFRATNSSFTPDGGYHLGDGYGSGYVHHYDKHDNYVASFGGSGTDDGKFRTPHGQWLDDRDGTPKIAVCDRANARLQFFDLNGSYLSKLDGMLFPADIDIQGDVMLVPDLHCRITLLDKDNKVITQLGDDPKWRETSLNKKNKMRSSREKWRPGKFVHPHDACFDADGNIFVAEWVVTGRVTKLRKL